MRATCLMRRHRSSLTRRARLPQVMGTAAALGVAKGPQTPPVGCNMGRLVGTATDSSGAVHSHGVWQKMPPTVPTQMLWTVKRWGLRPETLRSVAIQMCVSSQTGTTPRWPEPAPHSLSRNLVMQSNCHNPAVAILPSHSHQRNPAMDIRPCPCPCRSPCNLASPCPPPEQDDAPSLSLARGWLCAASRHKGESDLHRPYLQSIWARSGPLVSISHKLEQASQNVGCIAQRPCTPGAPLHTHASCTLTLAMSLVASGGARRRRRCRADLCAA